jgi:hypothetical protein
MANEPMADFAHREPVAHHHRPGTDEAFPARQQPRPLDGPSRGIGPVEHPHCLAVLRRRFEDVEQGRDIGIDAAAEILQVDEYHVERVHRLTRRAPHLAIKAEHRHAIGRIGEVRGLHHIVLKVTANAMLRPEHRGDIQPGCDERVEAVRQVGSDRGGVREQRDALAFERFAKRRVGEQAVDAEVNSHAASGAPSVSAKQSG